MRHERKQISLEHFKSRIPLLYNSFDVDGNYVHFQDMPFDDVLNYYPMGNYGMIPCDLVVSSDSAATISQSVAETTSQYAEEVDEFGYTYLDKTYEFEPLMWSKVLSSDTTGNIITELTECDNPTKYVHLFSYKTIKDMFYFFKAYDELLASNGVVVSGETQEIDECTQKPKVICDRPCKTATEYYKIFINNGIDETYQEYEKMDMVYFSFGGDLMKNFLYEQIFKRMEIPLAYRNKWKSNFLWYVDALKWQKWFNERFPLYEELEDEKGCKETENCCDCTEYFERGGHIMRCELNNYIDNNSDFDYITDSGNTTFEMQCLVTNSIDDMGEFSILSKEWEGGENYSSATISNTFYDKCGNESDEIDGGTVVENDGHIFIMSKTGKTGYNYVDSCWEFEFDSNSWKDYMYLKFQDPFSAYTEYAYDSFGGFHISNGNIDPSEMAISYPCVDDDYYIIFKDTIYNVEQDTEYIEFPINTQKSAILRVFTDERKQKYVWYKDKKFFARYKNNTIYFNLTRIPCIYEGQDIEVKRAEYSVTIGSQFYINVPTKSHFDIGPYRYQIIKKYVEINGIRYPIDTQNNRLSKVCTPFVNSIFSAYIVDTESFGKQIFSFDEFDNTETCYMISGNTFYVINPYTVYEVGQLTGTTDSKIRQLKDHTVFHDDIGVELQGCFNITTAITHAQPLENHILDLCYHIGNVARLTPIRLTDKTLYWGDILTDIVFYYVDGDGNKTTPEYSSLRFGNDNLETITQLNAYWLSKYSGDTSIDESVLDFDIRLTTANNGLHITDNLICEMTYYLGAILDISDDSFVLWDNDHKKYTCGVKYTDKYNIKVKPSKYNLTKSISYNIYYYNMIPLDETRAIYTDPKKVFVKNNTKTTFEVFVNSNIKDSQHADIPPTGITYSKYNNVIYSPVFREEYKFGTSSLQRVEENIYIDRGIDKAMDKGLKLIEITTLEDLEQYNNGFFKIISNS